MTTDDHRLLHPVQMAADLALLSVSDRQRLAAWVALKNRPPSLTPAAQRRRRRVLAIMTAAAAVLIPWIVVVAATLPNRHRAFEWRAAWVGFDVALATGLAATAWFGWRGRQLVIVCLVITSTLLICDAWFDVALSWGGREQLASVVAAGVLELPLAAFLMGVCHRILVALTAQAWRDHGHPDPPPPLRKVPLLVRAEGPDAVPLS